MNKSMRIFVMTAITAVSVPAYAGRDAGQMMQQETANKAAAARRAQDESQARCRDAAARMSLPLDHGPRAETTPWLNQQRRLKAMAKCDGAPDATSK